jgi:hypothetical protein
MTSTWEILLPATFTANWRRIVSTSGNSGIC